MNFIISLLIVFISSFFIQFFFISFIKSNNILDVNLNFGKLFLSLILSIFMVIIQIYIYNLQNNSLNNYIYLPFFLIIFVLIIFYRLQIYINDKEFVKQLLEESSNSLFISEKIKNKTLNKELKELSNNLIVFQKKQIEDLKNIIKDKDTLKKIIKSES